LPLPLAETKSRRLTYYFDYLIFFLFFQQQQ